MLGKFIFDKSYDLVIVGNITKDYFGHSKKHHIGGSSLYAGIGSAKLGLKTLVISNHSLRSKDLPKYNNLTIITLNNRENTEFLWTYKENNREGIIKKYTDKIVINSIDKIKTKMLMLAPVFNEIDLDIKSNFNYEICLLSIQGFIRTYDKNSNIHMENFYHDNELEGISLLSCSNEEEIYIDKQKLFNYLKFVSVTEGNKGARVYIDENKSKKFHQYSPAKIVDPTGAGDVFALYLLVYYYMTNNIELAANMANCAASFVVEKTGIEGIPDLNVVKNRLRENLNE